MLSRSMGPDSVPDGSVGADATGHSNDQRRSFLVGRGGADPPDEGWWDRHGLGIPGDQVFEVVLIQGVEGGGNSVNENWKDFRTMSHAVVKRRDPLGSCCLQNISLST